MRFVDSLFRNYLVLGVATCCLTVLAVGCAPKKAVYQVLPGEIEVAVEVSSFAFKPNIIQARAGEPLVLQATNVAGIAHNLTVSDPQGETLADVDLPAGQLTEIRLPPLTAGTYPFHCDKPLHPSFGMTGEIRVSTP